MHRKLIGVVLVGGLAMLVGLNLWPDPEPSGTTQAYAQQTAESAAAQEQSIAGAEQLSSAFRTAARAVKPSVVRINALVKARVRSRGARPNVPQGFPFFFDDQFFGEAPEEPMGKEGELKQAGVGSGFIVSKDGYILTNNHVVQEADELEVQLSDGRRFDGKVVGTDDRSDVAVVKIDAQELVPAKLGDSSLMDVGDWVIAVGSPFELDQTVTAGIISALNRSVEILDYEDFLQTDAAINPGNSGGPLVNLRGEVIGINTAINSRTGSNAGVGFAIPSSMAKQIMDSIIANGRIVRGFIGASLENLTLDSARESKLPNKYLSGAIIQDVLPEGPAAKAGIRKGDIVVQLDGKPLRDYAALRMRVALTPVGQIINMTVFRGGKEVELAVRVEEQTEAKMLQLSGNMEIPEWGIEASKLTATLAKKLGVDEQDGGVVVTKVNRDGKGAEFQIEPGDIIMKVNGKDVSDPTQLRNAIKNARGLRIMLRRGNQIAMLSVQ
ncbi:MAG: Do family serine endopeptidase [Pirellulaceae bacterium]|nr:Do family serine endopeptidase [Pirellulaceae bacterium]